MLIIGVFSAIGQIPMPFQRFDAGSSTSVELNRADEWAIYADGRHATPGRQHCEVYTSSGESLRVTTTTGSFRSQRGGHAWKRVASFRTDAPGTVTVRCEGSDGVALYGVANHPNMGGFAIRLAAGILGMLVLLLGGLGTGLRLLIRGRRARPN